MVTVLGIDGSPKAEIQIGVEPGRHVGFAR